MLAAETDESGRLRRVNVNWPALETSGLPIVMVIRIDGALLHLDEPALLIQIRSLAESWPVHKVAGIEIDYDCGTARLGDYALFLKKLRTQPGLPHRLSVTALPAWLPSSQFAGILAASDEVVLQVHAVRAPENGLFDPALARRWIDDLDRQDMKPYRVALPDYGTRIVRDASGAIVAVESEMPKLVGGASADELMAPPTQVAALLHDLERTPPAHLAGVVWFRLPAEGDARVWSLSTLQAVIRGGRCGRRSRWRPGREPRLVPSTSCWRTMATSTPNCRVGSICRLPAILPTG